MILTSRQALIATLEICIIIPPCEVLFTAELCFCRDEAFCAELDLARGQRKFSQQLKLTGVVGFMAHKGGEQFGTGQGKARGAHRFAGLIGCHGV